jgi:hypothetical protein
MGATLAIFWRKTWDNLGHVVFFNFIWFTLCIPFFLALVFAMRMSFNAGGIGYTAAPATSAESPAPAAAELGSTAEALLSTVSALPGTDSGLAAGVHGSIRPVFGLRTVEALFLLIISWTLACAATGFVFYAMSDLVTEYDFSGYRFIFRQFLRRGPVLRSIGLLSIFAFTFVATLANIVFYLILAQTKGPAFLGLAGVMLWFEIFVTMTCALALPIMAQRDLARAYAQELIDAGRGTAPAELPAAARVWPAMRTAAVIALSSPMRTFGVLLIALCIVCIGLISGAGVGFFVMAAPAALFNANVWVHLTGGKPSATDTGSSSTIEGWT